MPTKCESSCTCQSGSKQHIEKDCACVAACDDCYLNSYQCDCGHDTCRSPLGKQYDFENMAIKYYRYCLTLESDDWNFNNFSPTQFKYVEDM